MAIETPVVSEGLQKTFRDNFPSQIGAERDLHVSDTIIPIVDFSSTAGVSGLDTSLQQAIAFSNQTAFNINSAATTTIINNTGFFRIFGCANIACGDNDIEIAFVLSDGSSDKKIWSLNAIFGTGQAYPKNETFDFNVFLASGDSVKILTVGGSNRLVISGSTRQLADISGTLVNPTGYTGT